MKPKPAFSEKQRAYIRKCVQKYRRLFFLTEYDVNVFYQNQPDENDLKCAMSTTNPRYLQVVLEFYPVILEKSQKEIDWIVCHELMHCVLAPLVHVACERFSSEEQLKEAHELVTSKLSNIILQNEK